MHKFTESRAPPPPKKEAAIAVTHENVLGVEDLVDAFMHARVHGCVGRGELARELGVLGFDHLSLLFQRLSIFLL